MALSARSRPRSRPVGRGPRSGHALRITCLFGSMALPLRAEPLPSVQLDVRRSPDTMDCPDETRLREALQAAGAQNIEGAVHLEVRFDREADQYRAVVQASGARTGVRALTVPDTHCAPLLDALAVSIALLLDPDQLANAEAPPSVEDEREPARHGSDAPNATVERPLLPSRDAETPRASRGTPFGSDRTASSEGFADLTPTFAAGLTPKFTIGAEVGGTVRWSWGSARLGAAAFFPRDLRYAGGRVEGFLLSGRASFCADWTFDSAARLSACATGFAGRLSVSGTGYAEDSRAARPLFAVGPELAATWPIGDKWGASLRGAPLFLLAEDESFFIEGETGSAFRVAKVSAWLGVGIWSKIW